MISSKSSINADITIRIYLTMQGCANVPMHVSSVSCRRQLLTHYMHERIAADRHGTPLCYIQVQDDTRLSLTRIESQTAALSRTQSYVPCSKVALAPNQGITPYSSAMICVRAIRGIPPNGKIVLISSIIAAYPYLQNMLYAYAPNEKPACHP